jgi:hypothetical protein
MDPLNTNGPVSTKPGHVWTAPTVQGKNDADDCSIGCRHVSGLFDAACMPLALMRSADRVPINSASSELRPVFGLSQSSVTTDMHQLLFTLAIAVAALVATSTVFRRQPPVVFCNPLVAP